MTITLPLSTENGYYLLQNLGSDVNLPENGRSTTAELFGKSNYPPFEAETLPGISSVCK